MCAFNYGRQDPVFDQIGVGEGIGAASADAGRERRAPGMQGAWHLTVRIDDAFEAFRAKGRIQEGPQLRWGERELLSFSQRK